jgi:hypothetical protein
MTGSVGTIEEGVLNIRLQDAYFVNILCGVEVGHKKTIGSC